MTFNDYLRWQVFNKASLCRAFEEEVFKYVKQGGVIKSPVYLSAGQEFAPATLAVMYQLYKPLLFAQHRAHSTYLSFGGDPVALVDELLGLPSGCCRGMAGSPSIQGKDINMYGHDGFIGTEIPIGVGACFASKKFTIIFMGDAAIEEDYALATFGWAATKDLPVLFVVEDNNLSVLTEKKVRRNWKIEDVARGFGIEAVSIKDDPRDIYSWLIGYRTNSPRLVNIESDRLYWHSGAGEDSYQKRDRYLMEMEDLGEEAKQLYKDAKLQVENLWKSRLGKL